MNKLIIFALTALSFLCPTLSHSQKLCIDNPNFCGTYHEIQFPDACNAKTKRDFTFTSAKPIASYLRCDESPWGPNTWKLDCRLIDVTDPNNYVQVGQVYFNDIHVNNSGCLQSNGEYVAVNVFPSIPANSNQDLTHNSSMHVVCHFKNIEIQAGHTYGVNLRIHNYVDIPFPQTFVPLQLMTDENSQQITIGGVFDLYPNAWNVNRIMQPSFTSVSSGDITGKNSNREKYFIGTDNRVYNTVWNNGQWNIWCLDWNFTSAAPGAITCNPNNGEVYFIGTDGRVYNAVWANNQWNIWCLKWDFTGAAPGAITCNPNNGEVYVIGTDGRIYNCVWANNQWNIWCVDWNTTNAVPGGLTCNPTNGEVYYISTSGSINNCVWANNAWNIYTVGSFTGAAPGAITCNPSNGEVYVIGTDGRIYNCVWANNTWNVWCVDWNTTNAAPGAIVCNKELGQIFFIGTDGRIYNCVYDNAWHIYCLDWNYTGAVPGTLGTCTDLFFPNQFPTQIRYTVLTTNRNNQLVSHVWLKCLNFLPKTEEKQAQPEITSIENATEIVTKLQIIPNPITSSATITYGISETSNVSLAIYDITGKKLRDLVPRTNKTSGNYSENISKDGLSAGIYLIVLESGGTKKIEKIIIQ